MAWEGPTKFGPGRQSGEDVYKRQGHSLQQVEQDGGQEEEQGNGQSNAQHRGNGHDDAGDLLPQVVAQPLVKARELFFLLLPGELVRGEGQVLSLIHI